MNLLTRIGLSAASGYLRHSPLSVGRWRAIQRFLPLLRSDGSTLGERVVRTKYGFGYRADLGDWLGQYVYLTGVYEPPTARIIHALLDSGDTFIDVGANSGFFTLLGATRVGPTGKVLAFEPVPVMRKRLTDNVTMNQLGNVRIQDVALSNAPGSITLFEGPEGHKGTSSLRPLDNAATKIEVQTRPLDAYLDELDAVKLIKIDVEGAEQLVIEGMEAVIERYHPALIIEMTDDYLASFGHGAVALATKLTDCGYQMFCITPGGLSPMSPEQSAGEKQYNALFTTDQPPAHLLANT